MGDLLIMMNNGRWYYEEENRERKILAPATEALVARACKARRARASPFLSLAFLPFARARFA